jgi:hypothetical protein
MAVVAGVKPDDLVRAIDAVCLSGAGQGGGIVEGIEDIDWHDTGSSLIVSLAESVDRKAEPVSNLLSLSCIPRAAHHAARTTWIAVVPWTHQPWQSLRCPRRLIHSVRAAHRSGTHKMLIIAPNPQAGEPSDRHNRCLSSGCSHACCGVVRNCCCDVSVLRAVVFKPSAAPLPPPKPAIACTS